MTRNPLPLLALFFSTVSFASGGSPVVQGLGGAGRAGVPGEAIFTNPAAVGLLTKSGSFFYYTKPNIADWNAGGRGYAIGAYDGQNETVRGSFGAVRSSRAIIARNGTQGYEDRSEYRFALGRPLWANVAGGLQARYVTRRVGLSEEKFFDGDLGAIFPVYAGLLGGFVYENALNKTGERPPTAAAGVVYGLGYGIQAYGDGYRAMKGPEKGQRGWALGAEVGLAGDFKLRGGRFQDGYRRLKGWSAGLTWAGPRASFDYAMRTAGNGPSERDHIFGMTIAF
jgi:hypothetical protein